jgi:hypothetical protein
MNPQSLVNIFVPKEMFCSVQDVRKGDKFLAEIDVEVHSKEILKL